MEAEPDMNVTLPASADDKLVADAVSRAFGE